MSRNPFPGKDEQPLLIHCSFVEREMYDQRCCSHGGWFTGDPMELLGLSLFFLFEKHSGYDAALSISPCPESRRGFFALFGQKEQPIFVVAIVRYDHHSHMLWCLGFFY
jgi:hypothetical protein